MLCCTWMAAQMSFVALIVLDQLGSANNVPTVGHSIMISNPLVPGVLLRKRVVVVLAVQIAQMYRLYGR